MKQMRKRQKGFTLVELLIVVAILGILAAVVIPSVLGLMGRGSAQAYETDQEVIQLAVAAFYSDVHTVYLEYRDDDPTAVDPGKTQWGALDTSRGHYFPTAIGVATQHVLRQATDPEAVGLSVEGITSAEDLDNPGSFLLWDPEGNGVASEDDIDNHAIWMGLLVNADADGTEVGKDNRGVAAPLKGEVALYLQEMPQSAMHGESDTDDATNDMMNGATAGKDGQYCWIVGENGRVYGAYLKGTYWYAGFGGSYP